MRKFVGFLIGTVMGALVGATLAILLAPSSGDELRGELQSRFGKFTEELNNIILERREELEEQLSTLRKG